MTFHSGDMGNTLADGFPIGSSRAAPLYASDMNRKIKTAIRLGLMAFVAYGIIYQFPC
jgi:hypothetical protein